MPASQDPNLGLFYGWSFRESGWKTDMDANLLRVGALLHLSVKSRSTTTPPGSPSAGDRYWIPTGGTGAWAGHDHAVAVYRSGAWVFEAVAKGVLAYDESDGATYSYTGSTWTAIGTGGSGYLTTANTGLIPLTGAVQLPQYASGTYPTLTDADCGALGWDTDYHGLVCWTDETAGWGIFPVVGQLQVLGNAGITIVDSLRWNIGTVGAFASLAIKPEGSSAGMRMLGDGTFISDNIDGDAFLAIYPSDSAGLWGFDMIHPMTLSAGYFRLRKGTIYDPHDVLTIDNKGKMTLAGDLYAHGFVGDLTGTASGNAVLGANTFMDSQVISGSTDAVELSVQAVVDQTADIFQVKNSAGNKRTWVDSYGRLWSNYAFLSDGVPFMVTNTAETAFFSRLDADGVALGAGQGIAWSGTVSNCTAAKDLGLARYDAGQLKITNGSTGWGSLFCSGAFVSYLADGGGASPVNSWYLTSHEWDVASDLVLNWGNAAYYSATKDVGLTRASAGKLKVTDASTGYGSLDVLRVRQTAHWSAEDLPASPHSADYEGGALVGWTWHSATPSTVDYTSHPGWLLLANGNASFVDFLCHDVTIEANTTFAAEAHARIMSTEAHSFRLCILDDSGNGRFVGIEGAGSGAYWYLTYGTVAAWSCSVLDYKTRYGFPGAFIKIVRSGASGNTWHFLNSQDGNTWQPFCTSIVADDGAYTKVAMFSDLRATLDNDFPATTAVDYVRVIQ